MGVYYTHDLKPATERAALWPGEFDSNGNVLLRLLLILLLPTQRSRTKRGRYPIITQSHLDTIHQRKRPTTGSIFAPQNVAQDKAKGNAAHIEPSPAAMRASTTTNDIATTCSNQSLWPQHFATLLSSLRPDPKRASRRVDDCRFLCVAFIAVDGYFVNMNLKFVGLPLSQDLFQCGHN